MGQGEQFVHPITMEAQMSNETKKRANAVVTMVQTEQGLEFTVLGAGKAVLNLSGLHADVLERAAIHGLKQRVSDAAALPCDAETGKPATATEKYESLLKLVEHYNTGTAEWNRTRVAGEGKGATGAKTLIAIQNVYKLDSIEKAKAYVEGTAKKRGVEYAEALAIWRSSDKIREELARMAAAVPAKVDADDLLGELDGE
jgi:hypothetical protein